MPPSSSDTTRRPEPGLHAHIVNVSDAQNAATAAPAHAPGPPSGALPPTPTDEERALILRICLHATHDRDAAEDLAQETLLEAWRHWEKLREPDDPQIRARWLAAIAANVCRRWARSTGRDLAHVSRLTATHEGAETDDELDLLSDNGDGLDMELEHAERAQLLDRALGLLPPETREALIARYLLELPLGEIAARHGLSEATLSVRLHRAKQALRVHLATALREEALAYGLLPVTDEGWQETRIWCPQCGNTRLQGQLGGSPAHLRLRCPRCAPTGRGFTGQGDFVDHVSVWGTLDGVKTFKAALNRIMAWGDPYYRTGAVEREVLCRCRRVAAFTPMQPGEIFFPCSGEHGLRAICSCPALNHTDIAGMALFTPEGRRFWRAHPHIHRLPERIVEAGGREVIVVGYQAIGSSAQLDTLFARDSYELLRIHEPAET